MAWNGAGRKPIKVTQAGVPQRQIRSRGVLIGAGLIALVVVLVIVLWPSAPVVTNPNEEATVTRPKSRIKQERVVAQTQSIAQTNESAKLPEAPAVEMYRGQKVVSHSFKTNSTGRSVREIIVTADGQRHGKTTVIAKPTFHYSTDQMLADVLFPPERGSLPPLPEMDARSLDHEFAQSILDPIKINDDDPEDVRLKKQAVSEARHEVVKLLKEGHSVLEIIERERAANEDAHEMQLEVRKALFQLRKEGATQEELRDFLSRANETLEKGGIAPVSESATQKSRH